MVDEASGLKRLFADKRLLFSLLGVFVTVVIGGLVVFLLLQPHDPNQKVLKDAGKSVSFLLYYPSSLPSYYFIERGSVNAANNVVIFSISRNDDEKIAVTEQSLPDNFDLSQITGTKANIAGLGNVVIGTGFLGYRAVVVANNTLLIISSSDKITSSDFSSIVKSFRPV